MIMQFNPRIAEIFHQLFREGVGWIIVVNLAYPARECLGTEAFQRTGQQTTTPIGWDEYLYQ